jgi:hypothetical protein
MYENVYTTHNEEVSTPNEDADPELVRGGGSASIAWSAPVSALPSRYGSSSAPRATSVMPSAFVGTSAPRVPAGLASPTIGPLAK